MIIKANSIFVIQAMYISDKKQSKIQPHAHVTSLYRYLNTAWLRQKSTMLQDTIDFKRQFREKRKLCCVAWSNRLVPTYSCLQRRPVFRRPLAP